MKKNIKNIDKHLPDNDTPFTTPEGYFDGFSERLMKRIDNEQASNKEPRVKILHNIRPILTMAASFAAIFLIVFLPTHKSGNKLASNNNIATEMIDFVAYYFTNENDLIEAFEYEDLTENYDEAMLEEYLMASITDYDLIDDKK